MFCSTVSTDQTKFLDLQRQDFPETEQIHVGRPDTTAHAQVNNPQNRFSGN